MESQLELKYWDIEKIIPYVRNPRKNDSHVDRMAGAIKEFGFKVPILAKTDGTVIDGHLRLKAAKQLGITSIPVVIADDLTDAQIKAFRILANKSVEWADWDDDLLRCELKDLQAMGFDLNQTGLEVEDIDALLGGGNRAGGLTDPDEIPEPPEEPITKPGDLWLLGEHRLLCGDSTKSEDVDRLMGSEKAYLINTDPPYGVDYSKTKDGIPRPGFKDHNKKWGDIKNDSMDGPSLQSFLESVFTSVLPHLQNAAWYLWHAHLTQGFFAAAAAAANVVLHRQIIWKKPGFVLTRSGMYHWSHEPCFYGWIKGQRPAWYGGKSQKSVWEIGRDKDHGKIHPTQKPVELFSIPILNHLKLNEVCIEPFAGSGSQFIAAEQTNRRCCGLEIEPRYCDVIVKRWENFTGKKAVLG